MASERGGTSLLGCPWMYLTPNQIGKYGEDLIESELTDEVFAKAATVEVKLEDGTTFRFIPDFLVVADPPVRTFVDPDGVTQRVLNLRYIESKASRNLQPGIGTLSENQAVFLAALRNGQIDTLTPVGTKLNNAMSANQASQIDIVDFELVSFLVS